MYSWNPLSVVVTCSRNAASQGVRGDRTGTCTGIVQTIFVPVSRVKRSSDPKYYFIMLGNQVTCVNATRCSAYLNLIIVP